MQEARNSDKRQGKSVEKVKHANVNKDSIRKAHEAISRRQSIMMRIQPR